jgi:MFS family permease
MHQGIRLLLTVSIFSTSAFGLLGPLYAVFVEHIGGDILDIGIAYAAFMVATGVFLLVMSWLEDKYKKENMIVLGYFLGFLGIFGYIFVVDKIGLLAVQVVLGIAAAVNTPAYDALYSKFLDRGKESWEWGLWEAQAYIIGGIAAVSGALILEAYGFRTLFLIMAVFAFIAFLVSTRLIRTGKKKKRRT